jgi:hypothetical protein
VVRKSDSFVVFVVIVASVGVARVRVRVCVSARDPVCWVLNLADRLLRYSWERRCCLGRWRFRRRGSGEIIGTVA